MDLETNIKLFFCISIFCHFSNFCDAISTKQHIKARGRKNSTSSRAAKVETFLEMEKETQQTGLKSGLHR